MEISYKDIRNDRQQRASTGLNKEQFFDLLKEFKITYEDFLGETLEERQSSSTNESKLTTYEEGVTDF